MRVRQIEIGRLAFQFFTYGFQYNIFAIGFDISQYNIIFSIEFAKRQFMINYERKEGGPK